MRSFIKHLFLAACLAIGFSSCGERVPQESPHDGIYRATETTEIGHTVESSGNLLPLLNYRLTLRLGEAKMINLSTGRIVFEGPFDISPAPRSSPMNGSEQINVTVSNEVFKPSLYTFQGNIYYLKLDDSDKSLTIFSR